MKHKRFLSMLLALIMVLSLLPVSALAGEGDGARTTEISMTVGEKKNLKGSDYGYDEWRTSDSNVVKINSTYYNYAQIEAVGAGAVTVTHTYYVWKLVGLHWELTSKTDTWNVTVTAPASSDNAEAYFYALKPGEVANPYSADKYFYLGTGSVQLESASKYTIGKSFDPTTVDKTLPSTFPQLTINGKTYSYNENPKEFGYYYSMEWYQVVCSNGSTGNRNNPNNGSNNETLVSAGTHTWHVDGTIVLYDKYNVNFLVLEPNEVKWENVKSVAIDFDQATTLNEIEPTNLPAEKTVDFVTYVFDGWYSDEACTQKVDDNAEINSNANYYGKYVEKIITYSVTYDLQGGVTSSAETKFENLKAGSPTPTIAAPTKEGYVFTGWSPAVAETVTADATYTATWAVDNWKDDDTNGDSETGGDGIPDSQQALIKYVAKAGGSVTPAIQVVTLADNDGTGAYASMVGVSAVATPDFGHKFVKWTAPDASESTEAELVGDLAVTGGGVYIYTASFAETVTVTFDANGGAWAEDADLNGYTKGTSGGNNIAQKTVEKGSALTKPDAPAREDFVFKGWTCEGVDVAFVGQPVNADITLVAKWEPAPVVRLTYKTQQHFIDADGQEHLTINVQTFTADEGTAISTLIAGIAKDQMQGGIDYIYASAETKLNGVVLADDATLTVDNSVIDLYYYADAWKDSDKTEDPDDKDSETGGDNIPDCQQTVIKFQTGDPNGTVTGSDAVIQVFTLEKNNAGAYAGTILKDKIQQPDVNPKDGFVFYMWTVNDGEVSVDPFVDTAVVGGQVITYYAHFTVPGLSVVKTVESITRPDGTVRAEGEKADTGDTIVWKIEVENTGKADLRVSFEDTVKNATGETFLYQLGTFTGNKSEVKTALIMAGTTQTFYAEYTVLEADKGKTLTNTVTVSDPDKNVTGTDEAPGVEVEPVPPTTPPALNRADHYAYIIGYPDGTARPEGDITRAEVATIFFRLLEDEVRDSNLTKENSFSDVSAGDWYCTAVSTMAKLGIVTGYPDGTFRPNEAITRAELAAIAARFDDSKVISSDFSDMSGHWAEALVERAAALGWVNGYPDGTFKPDQDITRAEAMTLINNVLDRIPETAADLRDDMHVWPDNAKDAWYYIAVQEATVSHEYVRKSGSDFERWTALRNDPDWSRYNG